MAHKTITRIWNKNKNIFALNAKKLKGSVIVKNAIVVDGH